MRCLILVVFATCAVAVLGVKRCFETKDCAKDECCLHTSRLPISIRRGVCHKLSKEGERCSRKDDATGIFLKAFLKHCPCGEGLECKEDNKDEDDSFYLPIIGGKKTKLKCKAQEGLTTPGPVVPPVVPTILPVVTEEEAGDEDEFGDDDELFFL